MNDLVARFFIIGRALSRIVAMQRTYMRGAGRKLYNYCSLYLHTSHTKRQTIPKMFTVPHSSQLSSRGERTVLWPRRDPPLMCRVPLSVMLTLAVPLSTGMSSLYQVSTGGGLPLARHVIDAIVCSGSVWLAGPSSMTGGGRSSDDVTVRRARELSEPATLTAEHTTTRPLSFFCTLYSTVIMEHERN